MMMSLKHEESISDVQIEGGDLLWIGPEDGQEFNAGHPNNLVSASRKRNIDDVYSRSESHPDALSLELIDEHQVEDSNNQIHPCVRRLSSLGSLADILLPERTENCMDASNTAYCNDDNKKVLTSSQSTSSYSSDSPRFAMLPRGSSFSRSQQEIMRNAVPIPVSTSYSESSNEPPAKRRICLATKKSSWTPTEDETLVTAVLLHDCKNWKAIAEYLPGRNNVQCLQRWQKVLMPGLRKGAWTKQEDNLLIKLRNERPNATWSEIAVQIEGRSTKQCRERWTLCLDPSINRGPFTEEEDAQLLALYESKGPQWCQLKDFFANRTVNQLKSRFGSLRKRRSSEGSSPAPE